MTVSLSQLICTDPIHHFYSSSKKKTINHVYSSSQNSHKIYLAFCLKLTKKQFIYNKRHLKQIYRKPTQYSLIHSINKLLLSTRMHYEL